MQLFVLFSTFLFTTIECIENTFKIDFSFLLPNYNDTNQIELNLNDESKSNLINNKSFLQNISYYKNIKPITNICIGDPFQCFQVPISFNISETIFNLNSINFKYKKSSSFSILSDINNTFYVSDIIKLSKRTKNTISEFNFILINESKTFIPDLNIIGLGKNKLFSNYSLENEFSFSLMKQLKDQKFIETSEITIKYNNDFSGKITLGTNYTGMKLDESLYLELPNNENSLNGFLQSIYIVDTTIRSTKKQQIDLLEKEKRKRINIEFGSTFITFGKEIFEKFKTISFNSYINAGICDLKKDELFQTQYIICKDDILNSNLDKLFL